ncbi:MAG: hypothetical protein O7D94_12795, partial [Planctomycetota bacterium]|nr:hypothetical protein [Planctomycetota bacterium]
MRSEFIRGALATAALSFFGIGLVEPAQAQKNVGYYELCDGQGFPAQATAIIAAGHTPVNLSDLTAAALAGIDVAFITNCDNSGYSMGEYAANLPAITAAVNAGLVLVFHDRSVTEAAANIPGAGSITFMRDLSSLSKCNHVDVFDNTTVVTDGPGGVIGDGFLDFGRCSFHGTATQGTLPSGAIAILNRATHFPSDPRRFTTDQVVTFSYPLGSGHVIYSSIPLDFFLARNGAATGIRMRTNYAPNVIAYAASLAAGVMTSGVDHFLLYDVAVADRDDDDRGRQWRRRRDDDAKRIVSLSDQFDEVDQVGWFEVEEIKRLGNPVEEV